MTHLGVFTAGILARLKGPVLWCLASRDLFAPALARAGLASRSGDHAETWRDAEVLPVMEEGVRCPGLAGVVGEIGHLSLTASRRLQLAAVATGVVFLVSGAGVGAPSRGMAGELGGECGRDTLAGDCAALRSSDHAGSRPIALAAGAPAPPRRFGWLGSLLLGGGGLR